MIQKQAGSCQDEASLQRRLQHTHLGVPQVFRGACNNALFKRPPAYTHGGALCSAEPTNSANWVLIFLASTNHLNLN